MIKIIKEILSIFDIEDGTIDQFEILVYCLRKISKYTDSFAIENIAAMNPEFFKKLSQIKKEYLHFISNYAIVRIQTITDCQLLVQKSFSQSHRKSLAAYFTNDEGLELIGRLVEEYAKIDLSKKYTICDPFMGAGRTLQKGIKVLGATRVKQVIGVEPFYLSALVGYAALIDELEGDYKKITIFHGDAFKIIPFQYSGLNMNPLHKVDMILTNPPYTRWTYLNEQQRNHLLKFVNNSGYGKFMYRNETGLQTFAMFLCDLILRKEGLNIAVLPLSSFYTIGGKGIKDLLKRRYQTLALIESKINASFSEDSGFKEVVLVCRKSDSRSKTLFVRLDSDFNNLARSIIQCDLLYKMGNYADICKLPPYIDTNWLSLFENVLIVKKLYRIIKYNLLKNRMGYWINIFGKESIVRGFEMNGPDFFFLPNIYWNCVKDTETELTIQNLSTKVFLTIQKKFLVKSLRKPSLYYRNLVPYVDTYCLSIPKKELCDLPESIVSYIKFGKRSKSLDMVTLKSLGKYWYSHIYECLQSKRPYGYVFISDKVDLLFQTRSVFANYTPIKMTASKNFYVVKDTSVEIAKCICAWLNSTFFLAILIFMSRKISQTWTRLLENDYLELPIINFHTISKEKRCEIVTIFDSWFEKDLPNIWDQIHMPYRKNLDIAIAKVLLIKNAETFVTSLHNDIEKYVQFMKENQSKYTEIDEKLSSI